MSRRKTTVEFVTQGTAIYGTACDYTDTVYVKNDAKVNIRCVVHDLVFEQTPSNHLSFNGCPRCFADSQRSRFRKTTEAFIADSIARHGKKYTYERTVYLNDHTKVIITCRIHGDFETTPINHLKAAGTECQKCGFMKLSGGYFNDYFGRHPDAINKPAMLYFIEMTDVTSDYMFFKIGVTAQTLEQRYAAPSYKGFSIRTVWVAEGPLMLICALEGHLKRIYKADRFKVPYVLFHGSTECFSEEIPACIIEDDVRVSVETVDLVASRVLIKSGICETKLSARKLKVSAITTAEANSFFADNHIQGACSQAAVAYGLKDGDTLVCAMSLGKPRFGNQCEYELIRLATQQFTVVVGGASRLFKAFLKDMQPKSVVSFNDKFWNEGKVYEMLGFRKTHSTAPNYWYVKGDIRLSRIKCQKHKLARVLGESFDPAKERG